MRARVYVCICARVMLFVDVCVLFVCFFVCACVRLYVYVYVWVRLNECICGYVCA